MPDALHIALLTAAGLVAGSVNAVAGGGTFFTLPAMLAAGLPPTIAVPSNLVAVWPGNPMAAFACRREIWAHRHDLALRSVIALAGGSIGAILLLRTEEVVLTQLVPFLLIAATGLYALGGWLVRFLPRTDGPPRAMPLVESIAAVYGGYFGSGLGVMLLALLRLQGIENDHEANGLKNFLSALNGTTSAAIFIASGLVSWPETLAVFTGALLGGFGLGSMVRHVPRTFLRALVIASGLTLSVVYFWRVYGPA
ncbi:MAG: sulfite exporter TauE/SafE family protein [Hyphomicrobiaceae bacterium]